MKIIEYIKNLIKPKINVNSLANIIDVLEIPSRDELSEENIEVLEKYKSEYLNLLSKRILYSNELDHENIKRKINIYTDLLINILHKRTNIIKGFKDNILESETDNITNPYKIKLYSLYIEEIKTELKLKLIALKEIKEEKTFLLSSKKNALLNEIYNLSINYQICINSKFAIKHELDAFMLTSENIAEKKEKELLEDKLKTLYNLIKIILPNKHKELLKLNIEIKTKIAFIESIIEEYVYNHKEDLKYLREEIERLEKEDKTYNEQEKSITELEARYIIFDFYGRNIVSKEEITNFYILKLKSIVKLIIESDKTYNFKFNETEKEIYNDILIEKITDIITGNALALRYLKEEKEEVINNITLILKNINGMYDSEFILSSRFKISLLLACEKENGILELFDNFMVKKSDNKLLDMYEKFLEFEEFIPLSTIYKMGYSYGVWSYLFYWVYKEKDDKIFKVPEGIKEIFISKTFDDSNEFIETIKNKINGKIVILPSSLKYLES